METITYYSENLADLVAYHPDKLQTKLLAEKEAGKIILLAFAAGQELKTHTAPVDVLLTGLEGEAQLTVGQHTHAFRVGQVIRIPALAPHSLIAQSDFKMLLIK
jgi:quercetin dioxygenase-like cupin family protein